MNNATWLSCEASSYLRDHYIWAELAAAKQTTAAPPPQLTVGEIAAGKAEYAAKYTTKADNVNLSTPIAMIVVNMLAGAHASATSAVQRGRCA
jgi:hypothetical protein